jgi:hypothetical protein
MSPTDPWDSIAKGEPISIESIQNSLGKFSSGINVMRLHFKVSCSEAVRKAFKQL